MKKFAILILLVGFSMLYARSASACVCGGVPRDLTDEEIRAWIVREFDESIAVFSGEVVEIDRFIVKFRVIRLWKGVPADEITMSTGTVRVDEHIARSSSCDYDFSLGSRYLVYARNFEAGLVAYKCTRTRALHFAERDVTELDDLNPNAYLPPNVEPHFKVSLAFLIRRGIGGLPFASDRRAIACWSRPSRRASARGGRSGKSLRAE